MRNPSHTKKGSGRFHRDNRVYRERLAAKSPARANSSISPSMLPHLVKGYTFSTIPSKDVHTK